MSEKENKRKIQKFKNIQWGSKSPTSHPKTKEIKIVCVDEFDRFAKGTKTLMVIKIDTNVQSKNKNITMRPYKSFFPIFRRSPLIYFN